MLKSLSHQLDKGTVGVNEYSRVQNGELYDDCVKEWKLSGNEVFMSFTYLLFGEI